MFHYPLFFLLFFISFSSFPLFASLQGGKIEEFRNKINTLADLSQDPIVSLNSKSKLLFHCKKITFDGASLPSSTQFFAFMDFSEKTSEENGLLRVFLERSWNLDTTNSTLQASMIMGIGRVLKKGFYLNPLRGGILEGLSSLQFSFPINSWKKVNDSLETGFSEDFTLRARNGSISKQNTLLKFISIEAKRLNGQQTLFTWVDQNGDGEDTIRTIKGTCQW